MPGKQRVFSFFVIITFISLNSVSQPNLDVIVQPFLARIHSFAWAYDNETFVFLNSDLAAESVAPEVDLSEPAWQTFNVVTQELSSGQPHYPLQPELTAEELSTYAPLHFVLPSADNTLIAYSSEDANGRYVLSFANRLTGEMVTTSLLTGLEPYFRDGGLEGYWSQTDYAFLFLPITPLDAAIYYHIRIDPADLSSLSLNAFSDAVVDGKPYILADGVIDRAFGMSRDGERVLLVARERSGDPMNPTLNRIPYLVVWYPEGLENSYRISTIAGENICDAAFFPNGDSITLLLSDGRVVLLNLQSKGVAELNTQIPTYCGFRSVFSYDGSWVAISDISENGLRFLNINGLINLAPPTLLPPVAMAGQDQIFIDTEGDGKGKVTLSGEASIDTDGEIISYQWSQGLGQFPAGAVVTIQMDMGETTFTLTVTDNNGLQARDEVTIMFQAP